MKGTELLKNTEYRLLRGSAEQEISAVIVDNRKIVPGCLFICIRGVNFDAHEHIEEIARSGAAVIVIEESWLEKNSLPDTGDAAVLSVHNTREAKAYAFSAWYGEPSKKMTCIGITGSKGKTTTAALMMSILEEAGRKAGIIGTNGVQIGGEQHDLANTTPDSDDMQKYLAEMVEAGCEYAVIECSSQGLMLHRPDAIDFDYGIFTNIEEGDHVGPNEHRSFEEYLYCKSLMLRWSRVGIVNRDDIHVDRLLDGVDTPILFYGHEGRFDVNSRSGAVGGYEQGASREDEDPRKIENKPLSYIISGETKETRDGDPGIRFRVAGKLQGEFFVGLPGIFNAENALAALAVMNECGIPEDAMRKAIEHVHIKGRIDMVYRSKDFNVCVDFAHNGYSTRNLLQALREYEPKRLICIFGADGNRARSRRTEMGEASGNGADLSIVTSGHNRWETFEQILPAIEEGLAKTDGDYIVIPNRKDAIRYAVENRKPGDLITIIGLGHENYQEEKGVKYPYSDTDFVRSVLKEQGLIK